MYKDIERKEVAIFKKTKASLQMKKKTQPAGKEVAEAVSEIDMCNLL